MDTETRRNLAESAARASAEGRVDEARRMFAQALEGSIDDVRVLFLGFQFHFRAGEYDRAAALVERRLDVLGRDQTSGELARAYANLSLVHTFSGDLTASERAADLAIRTATSAGDEYELSRAMHNMAMMHEKAGRLDQARDLYLRALEIAERIGADDLAATKLGNLGDVAAAQSRPEEARSLWSRAAILFERIGQSQTGAEFRERARSIEARREKA